MKEKENGATSERELDMRGPNGTLHPMPGIYQEIVESTKA